MLDANDLPFFIYPNDIERKIHILHPECAHLRGWEKEKHPFIPRELRVTREALFPLSRCHRKKNVITDRANCGNSTISDADRWSLITQRKKDDRDHTHNRKKEEKKFLHIGESIALCETRVMSHNFKS